MDNSNNLPFRLMSEPASRPKQPPPVSGWSIMVACNNPRNGSFAGRADAFDLIAPDGDIALSFETDYGSTVRFAERFYQDKQSRTEHQIRFGGKRRPWFRTLNHQRWSGNWCWNQHWLTDRATARVLWFLWANFHWVGGWCVLTDRLEDDKRITAAWLGEVLREAEREKSRS
jgi:hypothetical protein